MDRNDTGGYPLAAPFATNRDDTGSGSFPMVPESDSVSRIRLNSRECMASSPHEALAYASNQVASGVFSDGTPEQRLSAVGLSCNMLLSIIGTTVLGISAQMKRGGWFFTPVMLIAGCAMVSEMTRLVSITIDILQSESGITVKAYQDFAEGALGKGARNIAGISSTFGLLFMICNGFILESKNLQFSLPISWWWPGDAAKSGQNWWALIISSTTLLYAFLPVGKLLQNAAKLGPVICVLCILFAWIGNGTAVAELKDFPDSCRDSADLPYWSLFPGAGRTHVGEVFLDIAGVASYGFYCFAVVVTIPTLREEMNDPSQMVKSSVIAYAIGTGLFVTIMLLGYWGSGNLGSDNLIESMRTSRPPGWWALNRPWETGAGSVSGQIFAWMMIINLLVTDAIYVPCTITSFEAIAPEFFANRRAYIWLRIAISAFRFLVAVYVDSFVALTNLTSALFCVIVNILLPILAYYKKARQKPSLLVQIVHGAIFVFGCIVLVMGSYGAIMDITNQKGDDVKPGALLREGISPECRAVYYRAIGNTYFSREV